VSGQYSYTIHAINHLFNIVALFVKRPLTLECIHFETHLTFESNARILTLLYLNLYLHMYTIVMKIDKSKYEFIAVTCYSNEKRH